MLRVLCGLHSFRLWGCRIWLLCIFLCWCWLLPWSHRASRESDIYSSFRFPGKQCALFMASELTFSCATPLKLARHRGGKKNIWENEPLGFHHEDCLRPLAWNRSVLETLKEALICILSRVLQGSSSCLPSPPFFPPLSLFFVYFLD